MALPQVERERLLNGNWKIRWQGLTFFALSSLLVEGKPVPAPLHCDSIYAILDTASKTGKEHDGTAVMWCAMSRQSLYPLTIMDWDLLQISGDLLEGWLPSVFARGEELARRHGARMGFVGAWVEDKASGIILNQQAQRRGLNVRPISSKLTSLGKDERALSVSTYVSLGRVKLSEHAYNKTTVFKGVSRNHLVSQVENFSLGDKNSAKRADDLLDCFTYSIALGLGNNDGF
jgi:hypothetical protein